MVAGMAAVKAATDKPFGVDLLTAMPGDLAAQVEQVIEGGASVFVAGLGVPADVVELCHRNQVLVVNMCGKVDHARRARDTGCDLVVARAPRRADTPVSSRPCRSSPRSSTRWVRRSGGRGRRDLRRSRARGSARARRGRGVDRTRIIATPEARRWPATRMRCSGRVRTARSSRGPTRERRCRWSQRVHPVLRGARRGAHPVPRPTRPVDQGRGVPFGWGRRDARCRPCPRVYPTGQGWVRSVRWCRRGGSLPGWWRRRSGCSPASGLRVAGGAGGSVVAAGRGSPGSDGGGEEAAGRREGSPRSTTSGHVMYIYIIIHHRGNYPLAV